MFISNLSCRLIVHVIVYAAVDLDRDTISHGVSYLAVHVVPCTVLHLPQKMLQTVSVYVTVYRIIYSIIDVHHS